MAKAKGFSFDDYSRANLEEQKEQIKADLLASYPIGTSIEKLEKDLLEQGANKSPINHNGFKKYVYYYNGILLITNSKKLRLIIYYDQYRISNYKIETIEFTGLK